MRIFVINMARSAERRERMAGLLGRMDLDWEFFGATDGRLLDAESVASEYDDEQCRAANDRSLTRGEIGCALSHRGIYRKMVDESISRAIILEDDVFLTDDFKEVVAALDKVPLRNRAVLLGMAKRIGLTASVWGRIALPLAHKLVKPKTNVWQAWGYCLDLDAARNLAEMQRRIFTVADDWPLFRKRIELGIVVPYIVGFEEKLGTEISNIEARPESMSHALVSQDRPLKSLARRIAKKIYLTVVKLLP